MVAEANADTRRLSRAQSRGESPSSSIPKLLLCSNIIFPFPSVTVYFHLSVIMISIIREILSIIQEMEGQNDKIYGKF